MLNTSYRIVNNTADAQDVLQESFLDAFRFLSGFREESSFGAWLKRIVVNRSLTRLRQRGLSDVTDYDDEYAVLQLDDPEAQEIITWKVEEVRKSIQSLPNGFRVVLSLYLLEGYDHEEIAGILHISDSTSRSQFLRGKKRLIELLMRKGIRA